MVHVEFRKRQFVRKIFVPLKPPPLFYPSQPPKWGISSWISIKRTSNRIANTQPKLRTNPPKLRTNRIVNKRCDRPRPTQGLPGPFGPGRPCVGRGRSQNKRAFLRIAGDSSTTCVFQLRHAAGLLEAPKPRNNKSSRKVTKKWLSGSPPK